MATRTRSLATRVVASLSSVEHPESSQKVPDVEEWPSSEFHSMKRMNSIATHLRKYSLANEGFRDDDSEKNVQQEDTDTDSESRQEGVIAEDVMTTEESFAYDASSARVNGALVVGPGGVVIPPVNQLKNLIPSGTVEIICLTWNVGSKSQSNLSGVSRFLSEGHPTDRADVICLCFQELPPTNAKYHEDAVKRMSEALYESHSTFCWVRKWSQMMMVFIRKSMIAFASDGPLVNRISDYSKICESLKFPAVHHFGLQACQSVKHTDCVFWFGDLNFRLKNRARVDALSARQTVDNISMESFFSDLLVDDELTIEKCKGNVFAEFDEARITFPPTHKFVAGSNDYVRNRIPSYTDRILFYSKDGNRIRPLMYDSLWDEDRSDHKPVYAIFTMRVVDCRH